MKNRIEELRSLKNGWLDGKGRALSQEGLNWFADKFENNYPEDLSLPYIYPTAEGGVQAEWTLGCHEVSLDVDFDTRQGEWNDLNMETDGYKSGPINLDHQRGWDWVSGRIRKMEKKKCKLK